MKFSILAISSTHNLSMAGTRTRATAAFLLVALVLGTVLALSTRTAEASPSQSTPLTAPISTAAQQDEGTLAPQSVAECVNGANGFVDVAYNYVGGTTAQSRTVASGVTVQLRFGSIRGVQRGWARISGATLPGDLVWMDWTTTANPNVDPDDWGWLQCGPFRVSTAGNPNTSAAQRTSSSTSWLFRACGKRPGGPTVCTDWI